MRRAPGPIVPIFRTETQGQILACIYLRPAEQWTIASLAREINASASTVHAEVSRLADAGLITSTTIGRARVLQPDVEHPLARPVHEMLEYIYGPRTVIAEEFSAVPGISKLLIFGSWAARHAGQTGPVPNDIDVLVVGEVDRAAVYAAADRAQERISLPVNPVLASLRRWETDADALIRQIKSEPIVDLTAEAKARSENT